MIENTLEAILDKLQDAEEMAFYLAAGEQDKFKKGRRRVIDEKIRDAIREIAAVIERESS